MDQQLLRSRLLEALESKLRDHQTRQLLNTPILQVHHHLALAQEASRCLQQLEQSTHLLTDSRPLPNDQQLQEQFASIVSSPLLEMLLSQQYHGPVMEMQYERSKPAYLSSNTTTTAAQYEAVRPAKRPRASVVVSPMSTGVTLAMSFDEQCLTQYQIFTRQQLEFFVSSQMDCIISQQGRRKQLKVGQVGIRCRHCALIPRQQRASGSVYYPQKLSGERDYVMFSISAECISNVLFFHLSGVYQAAQNMATTHLTVSCTAIPKPVRDELNHLRERRETATGGKDYWADACRQIGLTEDDHGIRFLSDLE